KIKGDLRILEILEKKDEQALLNLGDPSAFLNVFDPDKEEEKVSEFMASGLTPEEVEADMDATASADDSNEGDWLMQLFGGQADQNASESEDSTLPANSLDAIVEPASLFE